MQSTKPPPPGLTRAQRAAWEYLHRPRCPRCGWRVSLHERPAGSGALLCADCWPRSTTTELDGHRFTVACEHPERGRLPLGTIHAAGIRPGGLQPAICWRLTGHDGRDLGEHAGDFVTAVALLLN